MVGIVPLRGSNEKNQPVTVPWLISPSNYSPTMKLMLEELIEWDMRSSISARKISNSVARKPFARKTDNFKV